MQLVTSKPSAFGRKIEIVLREKGIPYERVLDVPWDETTIVPRHSPLEQLPILVSDDGENIYDSMYIVEWLERKYPALPLLPTDDDAILAVKRVQLLAERLMEIVVLLGFEEQRSHPSAAWLERQRRKVAGGIDELAALIGDRTPEPDQWIHYGDIAAGPALTWFDFLRGQGMFAEAPETEWRNRHPNLVRYVDALEARPSFRETRPEMFEVDLPAVVR